MSRSLKLTTLLKGTRVLSANSISICSRRCNISTLTIWHTSSLKPLQPVQHSCIEKRLFATMTDGEQKIHDLLLEGFPKATAVKVEDISGGCGAMYDVFIESQDFNGKKLIQQHLMVNKVLKAEIADMHGIRITTRSVTS